jgi:hypothetical protein
MVFRFTPLASFLATPFVCAPLVANLFLASPIRSANADVVHSDDMIIAGSLCVGLACASGENFGFDTLLLKQEVVRLRADDTSAASSFPSNDWQLTFNDRLAGGANKFSIDDVSGGRTPFTLEAGAPNHSLYIDTLGRIGMGTNSPAVQLHVKDGETPSLRLEQDSTEGFTAQVWDVAGNENNFFIRDLTHSARLPFRIRPGALNNSILIGPDGNVLIGATSAAPAGENPIAALHVQRSDGTARFLVEETSTTAGNRSLMFLDNAGGRPRLQMKGAGNASQTGDWSISAGNTFVLQERVAAFNVMIVDQVGNMTIGGALTQNSDKNSKMAILPVDPDEILAKVAALPISAWTYKNDAESGIRHIGPMAQDFYAAFETGAGPTGISTIDTSGVALAAIKALAEENALLKARLDALEGLLVKQD